MSLGMNINRLRVQKGLSQDALAEIMEVSRQSVSKWENDAALPELDKLVKLSELFGVTLDELILDKKPEAPAEAQAVPETPAVPPVVAAPPERPGLAARQIVGIVLMCFAGLCFLLISLYFGPLVGLMVAVLPTLCGLLCLVCRRRPGFWCAWTVFVTVTLYMRIVNGVTWLFLPAALVRELLWKGTAAKVYTPAVLAVSGAELLILAGLTVWTCRAFRELRLKNGRRFWLLLALGAVLWLVMPLAEDLALRSVMEQGIKGGIRVVNLLMILVQYAGLALFELLAASAAALIRRRRERREEREA